VGSAGEEQTGGWRRLVLPLLLGCGVIAAFLAWPRPLPVAMAPVLAAPVRLMVSEPARVRLRDRYLVTAPLAGVVSGLALRPGDAVQAGHVVARLAPSGGDGPALRGEAEGSLARAESRSKQADADVASADAERARVRANAQRAEVLYAQRLIARDVVEVGHARAISADAALRAALAQRDAARAEREAARAVVALQGLHGAARQLQLVAPAAGVVLRRLTDTDTDTDTAVAAGQPLMEIGNPGAVEILAELRTTHALHLVPGAAVRLAGWGGAGELDARVRSIEPDSASVVDAQGRREQRVTVVADLDPASAARARLSEGSRLQARFAIETGPDAVGVPADALVRDGPRWAVFVVESGRARLRHVEPGPVGEALAAIYAGLTAGERVVRSPDAAMRDGWRVRPRR
jgi:HlyD family secretion protein